MWLTHLQYSVYYLLNISYLFNLQISTLKFLEVFFLKWYYFPPFEERQEVQKLCCLACHNILQQCRNNLSYRLSIFLTLKEHIIHSSYLWLYWSFVIPIEWNWYFLTKCNLLEQTSSQVLMKRILGNSHSFYKWVMLADSAWLTSALYALSDAHGP